MALPAILIAIALLILTAVAMYFVGKFVPLLGKIASIIIMLYFLGLFLSLQNITILSDLLAKLPFMSYILSFGIGSWIGSEVASHF